MTRKLVGILAAGILTSVALLAQNGTATEGQGYVAREVRHEILTLPLYSVFDDILYQINGSEVTLTGWVTRPVLKRVIQTRVSQIEGVEKVDNKIDVLPLLSSDNALRIAVYNAVYGNPALQRYAFNSIPPIRIIVNFGRVTLIGVVNTVLDKKLAVMMASQVTGVIGKVTDDISIDPNG